MKRHALIGRLGAGDRSAVPTRTDEVQTRLDLVASERRLGFGIGQALDELRTLHVYPTEVGVDLLVLASLVHAADTRISRTTESQDTWSRELRLVVPVSDPDLWRSTHKTLEKMLHFLTGDLWQVEFRPRPKAFSKCALVAPSSLLPTPFTTVSLFSGGLDSLIGAIDLMEAGTPPLLVSHAGEGATSDSQTNCLKGLEAHYKAKTPKRLRVWMNFPKALVKNVGPENTTRGRSFLFIAIAAFAGTGLAKPFALNVPENGLIALNVPLDRMRLGSLSTRTTHPFYLARWSELLAALGINGTITNPYWNRTKGEMMANCRDGILLKSLVPHSLSCAAPTKGRWHGHGIEHCGYCLPCLIRRAAIDSAYGAGADPTSYTLADLKGRALDTNQAEGRQVRSFQFAIDRLAARPSLVSILVHKPGPLSDEGSRVSDWAGVYTRGLAEVGVLLKGARTSAL